MDLRWKIIVGMVAVTVLAIVLAPFVLPPAGSYPSLSLVNTARAASCQTPEPGGWVVYDTLRSPGAKARQKLQSQQFTVPHEAHQMLDIGLVAEAQLRQDMRYLVRRIEALEQEVAQLQSVVQSPSDDEGNSTSEKGDRLREALVDHELRISQLEGLRQIPRVDFAVTVTMRQGRLAYMWQGAQAPTADELFVAGKYLIDMGFRERVTPIGAPDPEASAELRTE